MGPTQMLRACAMTSLATAALANPLLSQVAEEKMKPNIVIVLADDLGYGSVGCYGAPENLVQTPHIDRLASEGVRFTDANTPSSVCTPTRYALLTGRYCWRSRLKTGVSNVHDPLLIETNRPVLSSLLKRHDYHTAMIGKWHLGYGTAQRVDWTAELRPGPLELGFDYQFAVPQNNGDMTGVYVENDRVFGLRSGKLTPNPPKTFYGPRYLGLDAPQREETENMPVLTDKALAWLETVPAGKPFFLYFAATAVHEPVWPSKKMEGKSGAGHYTDFIQDLDNTVGQLLDALEKRGDLDNTLFLFTSDNGGVLPPPKSSSRGDRNPATRQAVAAGLKINGNWRGRKHRIWEGGFRVPFVIRWPGIVPASTVCHQTIGLVDTYATVAELLEDKQPKGKTAAPDSVSYLRLLKNPMAPATRKSIILHNAKGVFAIRQGKWKYIEGKPFRTVKPGELKHNPEYHAQLYDLVEDPAESRDVLSVYPEIGNRLQNLLERHRTQTSSNGGAP